MIEIFAVRGLSGRELSGALLTESVRRVWGTLCLPPISRGEYGKPYFPDCPQWQFSLSHSGPLALCALSDRPVGADIELIRPRGRALLERALTEEERTWCLGQEEPWRGFCALWTRRESLCKQTGRGLTLPVREIEVPLPPAETRGELHFRNYHGSDWVAAVCGWGELPAGLVWLEPEELA